MGKISGKLFSLAGGCRSVLRRIAGCDCQQVLFAFLSVCLPVHVAFFVITQLLCPRKRVNFPFIPLMHWLLSPELLPEIYVFERNMHECSQRNFCVKMQMLHTSQFLSHPPPTLHMLIIVILHIRAVLCREVRLYYGKLKKIDLNLCTSSTQS